MPEEGIKSINFAELTFGLMGDTIPIIMWLVVGSMVLYGIIALIKRRHALWWALGGMIPGVGFLVLAEAGRQALYKLFEFQNAFTLPFFYYGFHVLTIGLYLAFYRRSRISAYDEDKIQKAGDLLINGFIHYRRGQYVEANRAIRRGLELDPQNPRLLLARKVISAKLGTEDVTPTPLEKLRHNLNMLFLSFHKKE